jgi:hypothetical protein
LSVDPCALSVAAKEAAETSDPAATSTATMMRFMVWFLFRLVVVRNHFDDGVYRAGFISQDGALRLK